MKRVVVAMLMMAACGDDRELPEVTSCEARLDFPILVVQELDVLFVIDRSASMADEQARLRAYATALAAQLDTFPGGMPDVHIGVTSSDLGGVGVPGCGAGDDGRLLNGERCGSTEAFLALDGLADGSVAQSFEGSLTDALVCLTTIEASTCPVSQPMAAAVRAVDGAAPGNQRFRREGQPMMLVVVTDTDDCSLVSQTALDGVTGTDAAAIEAAVDHRCFALGSTCAPADPTTPGPHTGCGARPDGGLAAPANLVATVFSGHGAAIVSLIASSAVPEVAAGPTLVSSCSAPRTATAAPRLHTIADAAPVIAADVCADDWTDGLEALADIQRQALGVRCAEARVDRDPVTPGYQPTCAGQLVYQHPDQPTELAASLPWCTPGLDPAIPCLEPFVDALGACTDGPAVLVHLGDLHVEPDLVAEVRCEVDCTE